uniref:E3 ubiquitin-protein ligase n=1 Tax=Macrostomum lignano TaxID=282301 RepID=A0A1I8GZP2_9PLAT
MSSSSAAAAVGTSREQLAPGSANANGRSVLGRVTDGVSVLTRWLTRSSASRRREQQEQQEAEIEAEEGSRYRRRSSFFQKLHMGDHEMTATSVSGAAGNGANDCDGESSTVRNRAPVHRRLFGWMRQ